MLRTLAIALLSISLPTLGGAQQSALLTAPDATPSLWGALRIPPAPGPHPAVILLYGSAGWRAGYLEIADRLAEAGFAALVLDYYAGTGGAPVGSQEKLRKWEAWRHVVQEAGAFLQGLPSVAGDRLALVGYSRGAFLAVSVAASMPAVRAVVDFYGGGGGGTRSIEQEVKGLPPLLILHGEDDSVVPVRFAQELRSAVDAAGGTVEMHLFPGEGHAFNAPWAGTYSPQAADRSLALAIAFLRARIGR